ncbi:MAG: type I restriction enzyme HsdR N-terminal domain-containing protein [Bacteroidetes bacterium]|nr:type I restriction enzyme HsdR N-terminal domain-containing protein [Bacteroidota bacterium]
MRALNLPGYSFKLKESSGKVQILDELRKKYVVLTPEEWVRQHIVQYLIQEKKYPSSLIAIEIGLKYNQLQKRADILVYDRQGTPILLVECKAPEVKITQDVFHQIAVYNMSFKVRYLLVTNGMDHFICEMDYANNSYQFLKEIPVFI